MGNCVWSVFVILIISSCIYSYLSGIGSEQIIKKCFSICRPCSRTAKPEIVISRGGKTSGVRHRMINNYNLGQIGIGKGNAVKSGGYILFHGYR